MNMICGTTLSAFYQEMIHGWAVKVYTRIYGAHSIFMGVIHYIIKPRSSFNNLFIKVYFSSLINVTAQKTVGVFPPKNRYSTAGFIKPYRSPGYGFMK